MIQSESIIQRENIVGEQWTPNKAQSWYANIDLIRGCNYLPRTAINTTKLWQASTFDPETINQELGWAADAGYNGVRIFVQYLVWQDDPDGLKQRMDQLLTIASQHNIRAMFTLFDDCAFAGKEPYLGPQDDPVPGVHNSGWTPSPGLQRVTDKSVWPSLEQYVKDIVGRFGHDPRVLIWDLYNEPGNSKMGEKSLPLIEASFAWARAANPERPLTISAWQDAPTYHGQLSQRMLGLSDVVSFHYYNREGIEEAIKRCQTFGRPVINTEWLHRPKGNTCKKSCPSSHESKLVGITGVWWPVAPRPI
ncbi:glycoside hydrolase family 5 protein [Chloroflexi bacterium TSY]|nr:glycoside hydrolase family 5 protein [Chloroflexi bacterium TSY]